MYTFLPSLAGRGRATLSRYPGGVPAASVRKLGQIATAFARNSELEQPAAAAFCCAARTVARIDIADFAERERERGRLRERIMR